MKKLLISALLVAFASSTVMAAAAPETITLDNKQGKITFNHKGHSGKMDCTTCHASKEGGKIELDKASGHKLCLDCHKTKGAGPTKCGECHKK